MAQSPREPGRDRQEHQRRAELQVGRATSNCVTAAGTRLLIGRCKDPGGGAGDQIQRGAGRSGKLLPSGTLRTLWSATLAPRAAWSTPSTASVPRPAVCPAARWRRSRPTAWLRRLQFALASAGMMAWARLHVA